MIHAPHSHKTLLITGILLATLCPTWAQGYYGRPVTGQAIDRADPGRVPLKDPGELYLTAYRLCRESEDLAKKQNYNAAISKGRQAEKVLAGIVRDFPQWKPNLVAARRKLLAENLKNYRLSSKEARIPTGREPGSPISTDVPIGDRQPTMVGDDYRPVELPNRNSNNAAANRELYSALVRAQEECRRMARAYKELSQKHDELRKKLNNSQAEGQIYKDRYDALQKQIVAERKAGNRVVDSLSQQLAEMEARYQASEQARKEAEARVTELEAQLATTQEELERVKRERDALKTENEQLRAIVELNSPEKTKALFDQNITLAAQLKDALNRVAELEAQISGSADQNHVLNNQLKSAREDANRLRDEMSGLYEENMGYRRRVSELTEHLNNLEADLKAKASQPVVDPALAEENRLLRDVIAKLRRSLLMQEEGRKLLKETYQQLKEQTPEMMEAIKKLEEESSLDLTEADRRMIEAVRKEKDGGEAVRQSLQLETLADMAAKAFAKGRYTAAEQLYRTLNESQPDNVAGLVNLGTILLYRNKCEESVQYLIRAQRLAPDLAISYFQAGVALYRLDRMEEARRMFQRTIELDPGNADAFFYLANIEGISGQYALALNYYAAAVKLKPDLGDAHYNMARLYAEMQRIPDAARCYDRAIHSGAEPDPEFETYLREHPDNAQTPGVDLVELIKPEDEAARLRAEDQELARLLEEHQSPDEAVQQALQEENRPGTPQPEETHTAQPPRSQEAPEHVSPLHSNNSRGYEPSPAGQGHETNPSYFSSKRVRCTVDGKRKTISLRLKKPEPIRLRNSKDGSYTELKKTE